MEPAEVSSLSQAAIRQPIPIGKYFLDRKKITKKQLELALRHRQEFGLKLGQSLVELGFVTESDMIEALRHQARFPCVHLTTGLVDPVAAARLPEAEARRLNVVLLNTIAGYSTLAMPDPADADAVAELAQRLDTRVFPVYSESSAIRKLLDHIYRVAQAAKAPPAAVPPEPARASRHEPVAASAPASVEKRASVAMTPAAEAPAARPRPVEGAPDEKAVVDAVRGLLQQAFDRGVGDVHLETRREELVVRFRHSGALVEHQRLPAAWSRSVFSCLKALGKGESQDLVGSTSWTIPFLFKKRPISVRVTTTHGRHGECAVLQVTERERERRVLEDLGLSELQRAALSEMLAARDGLVLVSGPSGGGLTTTLQAALTHLAAPGKKLVTLEGKLELELEEAMQVELDPALGLTYAEGARTLVDQDPDVLLVGAIDGPDTARNVLEAAMGPRLVLTTVPILGACEALARLLALDIDPYLVAERLRGVVSQRLARRVCADCSQPVVPDGLLLERLGATAEGGFREGEGCASCHGTGTRGHVALFEVLLPSVTLRRAIEKGSDAETLRAIAHADGVGTLREHALELARNGTITLSEVLATTPRS